MRALGKPTKVYVHVGAGRIAIRKAAFGPRVKLRQAKKWGLPRALARTA